MAFPTETVCVVDEDAWWELEAARGDRWREQLALLSQVQDLHEDGVVAGVVV